MGAERKEARLLVRRLGELGRVTDEPGRLTRTFLSPAMRRANRLVGRWMREAGLSVREDGAGNLIGRLESPVPGAKTLLIGSHLDTVPDAGRYDGALGVLLGIAVAAEVRRRRAVLPFALEILGFSEEEGVRFACAYLGSRAYAGRLTASDLALRDSGGATVRQVLEKRGGKPFRPPGPAHRTGDLIGYVEAHIEQGPVLEDEGRPVGVVSAIAGQTRGRIRFRGRAGHAGTTPMRLRRDALAGAAEFVLFAEALARRRPPLVATVGAVSVAPGSPNVIPGEAVVSLDVRHPADAQRRAALRRLVARARLIARRRGLAADWRPTQDHGAVACSPLLTGLLEQSVAAAGKKGRRLVSGAGHDAVVLSALAPVAMLFVRCRKGLSHHPDEFASGRDIEAALGVLVEFVGRLSARESRR